MKQIPNLFTLLNLFFGCIAIVFALQTESVIIYQNEDFLSSFNIPEKLVWAGIFIFIAGIIDFADGFVARIFNATSAMGEQLDTLADVVSFGVAPGVILYQLLRFSFAREENGLEVSIFWLLPAFILSCAAAYRLAKFNLDEMQTYNFKGIPTPAVGLLIASFPLILHFNAATFNIGNLIINKWFIYALILVLSYLMVCNISFMGMKFRKIDFMPRDSKTKMNRFKRYKLIFSYAIKNNFPKVILISIGIVSTIFLQWLAVPIIFCCYILLSLLYKNRTT